MLKSKDKIGRIADFLRGMLVRILLLLLTIIVPSLLFSINSTQKVSDLFHSLKKDPQALRLFLLKMPKGGELHYHWDGSSYPENLAYDIRNDSFCYDAALVGVEAGDEFCPKKDKLNDFGDNPDLYQKVVNNWSLTTNFANRVETNQHFFQYFLGTEPVTAKYSGRMLADERNRAATQHEAYMEMTYILDVPQMLLLGSQINDNSSLKNMEQQLASSNVTSLVNDITKSTNDYYQQSQKILGCGTAQAQVGCKVKVRFLFSALRNFNSQTVFSELYVAFKVANQDPLVLGIDLVGPENSYNASRDYTLQMQMVHFLHQQFPKVHVRLHAGELSLEESPPNFMRYHVDQAINIAGAERIGHGVDIAYETNGLQVLREMARKHIAVEQLLTSNEKLLDIKGKDHPLPLFLRYHVPVVLSTDDEGILRTTLTNEFYKAVTRYNLSYAQIKSMVRNVGAYNFLPGKNLWRNLDAYQPVKMCAGNVLGSREPSASCQKFLASSEKAQLQWQIDGQLHQFEKNIVGEMS
jgi:adenosine deaminase